ncbi:MAG: hypothetical protein KGJ37_03810 [Verrucomicrobiota bacterium]|nr:hypothetical protein [Verrucomicrobiota bacterium]
MARFATTLLFCALAMSARGGLSGALYEKVSVEPVKTSIYFGYVKLTTPAFTRTAAGYTADYHASVVPFFFWNEHGSLTIEATDDDLQRLARGETVYFKGHAANTQGQPRLVEGRAVPQDATRGRLKLRIFVSRKIQLIFNTTYHFIGGEEKAEGRKK